MARRIRWLGVGMVVCFFILFLQLNNIQVVKAHQYATDPNNPTVIAESQQPRGVIQSADGQTLAKTVPAPKGSANKYERDLPRAVGHALLRAWWGSTRPLLPTTASRPPTTPIWWPTTSRSPRSRICSPPALPSPTPSPSPSRPRCSWRPRRPWATRPGPSWLSTPRRGPSWPCTPTPPTTRTPWPRSNPTESRTPSTPDTTNNLTGFAPFTYMAYQDSYFAPGSTFKTVTTAAAYDHAPQLVNTPIPSYGPIPPGYFKGQTTPIYNDSGGACGGTIAMMLPESCDTGYAILGTKIGAASMTAEADELRLQPATAHRPAPRIVGGLRLPPAQLLPERPGLPGLLVHRAEVHDGQRPADGHGGVGLRRQRRPS